MTNTWLPYAYDDQGPISQDWNYQFKISPLWRWHPWLQFYVAAASFKLLGISAFSARLPFALLGIISYWYFLNFLTHHGPSLRAPRSLGEVGRGNLVFFLTAAVLFLFSVPLLLHLRQARYYSLSLLFTLIAIDGYLDKNWEKYIFGSVLLFHSFLPAALALQTSFWIHQIRSLLAERQGDSLINTKRFAIAFSATILFTLPWAVWLKIGGQNLNFSPELIKQHTVQHYLYIHKFIFPAFTLIPLISPILRKKFLRDDKLILLSIFISTSLLLYTVNHPYFFRYLVPLIPIFIYVASWIFTHSKRILQVTYVMILIQMVSRTFPGYIYEITHGYQGTNKQLILLLNSLDQNRYKNLAVNYDDFTFRFHTGLRVIGPQELPVYSGCPEVIVIFPDWGNEDLLQNRALECGLLEKRTFAYEKLADDPDPVNHRFSVNQLTHTLEVFLAPPSPS